MFSAVKRQVAGNLDEEEGPDENGYWWYSPVSPLFMVYGTFLDGEAVNGLFTRFFFLQAASAIKWAIMGAVFLIAILWSMGGYYHAQRRMKKGLRPLAYHRVRIHITMVLTSVHLLNEAFSGFFHALSALSFLPHPSSPSIRRSSGALMMDT